jgi:hypothetical protein
MTIGKSLKTTLSSLRSVQADLESFALETENPTAKDMFNQFADQAKTMVEGLQSRVMEIEKLEPQYKNS